MVFLQVPQIPPTGNQKVDAIVQVSILGVSVASVLLAAFKAKPKRKAPARRMTRAEIAAEKAELISRPIDARPPRA